MTFLSELLADPSFWLLIVFLSFLGVATRPVGRVIGQGLDQRAQTILQRIEEASQLMGEAKNLFETYTHDRDNAASKAKKFLNETEEGILRLKNQAHTDFLAECARKNKTIALKVNMLEETAMGEVRDRIALTAITATNTLLKAGVTHQVHDALISQAVTGIATIASATSPQRSPKK